MPFEYYPVRIISDNSPLSLYDDTGTLSYLIADASFSIGRLRIFDEIAIRHVGQQLSFWRQVEHTGSDETKDGCG